jgi:hypothetical protein
LIINFSFTSDLVMYGWLCWSLHLLLIVFIFYFFFIFYFLHTNFLLIDWLIDWLIDCFFIFFIWIIINAKKKNRFFIYCFIIHRLSFNWLLISHYLFLDLRLYLKRFSRSTARTEVRDGPYLLPFSPVYFFSFRTWRFRSRSEKESRWVMREIEECIIIILVFSIWWFILSIYLLLCQFIYLFND